MKAYQLMMFLLLLNLSISLIGVLNIYNPDAIPTTSSDYDPSRPDNVEPLSVADKFFGSLLTSVVIGTIAGAVVSYFTKVPADSAFAYSLFATSFWAIAYNALSFIWEIYPNNAGIGVIIVIFTIVLAGTFAAGLAQLIRGGWKSFV